MNMEIIKDVSYGTNERHRYDIFFPKKPVSDRGVLLFIHGGGWSSGDKSAHFADAEYFCKRGYICASMNYRYVAEDISVFDELDDVTACLLSVTEETSKKGFNVTDVILSGGSAGAHLAMLYAYTRKEKSPLSIVAVCAYCPPVNCYSHDFLLGISGEFEDWKYGILSLCCGLKLTKQNYLDEPQQRALKRISPSEYISCDCMPTAVFPAVNDELVPIRHVRDFITKLNENNVINDIVVYEISGHALDKDPEAVQFSKDIIERYLHMYL